MYCQVDPHRPRIACLSGCKMTIKVSQAVRHPSSLSLPMDTFRLQAFPCGSTSCRSLPGNFASAQCMQVNIAAHWISSIWSTLPRHIPHILPSPTTLTEDDSQIETFQISILLLTLSYFQETSINPYFQRASRSELDPFDSFKFIHRRRCGDRLCAR